MSLTINIKKTQVITIALLSLIMLFIDIVYLTISQPLFSTVVKSIQKTPLQLNYYGALGAYISMVIALYYFIIRDKKTVLEAGLLGMCVYATFDFTNMAIFKNWDIITAIIDIVWGGILFMTTTYSVYKFI